MTPGASDGSIQNFQRENGCKRPLTFLSVEGACLQNANAAPGSNNINVRRLGDVAVTTITHGCPCHEEPPSKRAKKDECSAEEPKVEVEPSVALGLKTNEEIEELLSESIRKAEEKLPKLEVLRELAIPTVKPLFLEMLSTTSEGLDQTEKARKARRQRGEARLKNLDEEIDRCLERAKSQVKDSHFSIKTINLCADEYAKLVRERAVLKLKMQSYVWDWFDMDGSGEDDERGENKN